MSAYTQGIGANFPGQSVFSCGQESQVAACGSHSAGILKPSATGAGFVWWLLLFLLGFIRVGRDLQRPQDVAVARVFRRGDFLNRGGKNSAFYEVGYSD